ncbi:hypothetical protein C7H19_23455 [Aphanothece hegewaldii CCALA 016]|uniref:Uncharacterized protein n=1 Tax=Aphanothece hegewaldii CCALA 016 TaxID=2107694 RepID=A0A2T1LRB8_9CHRO|nr:hypothetical protein [Aphanothece hegewaldii]PSF30985.1 hypothetical protein C7H19_23455 [Aphanothece hegewaldii CCALA 016]
MFERVTILGILASFLSLNLPVQAETCTPIPVAGSQDNTITKKVSPPTIPAGPLGIVGVDVVRNNWNTDWAIPGDIAFRRFVVTLNSNDGGPFEIRMYLKYSDQTAGEFFNSESVQFQAGKPLILEATPRPEDEPYQVNLFVNGVEAIDRTYTASVVGCR